MNDGVEVEVDVVVGEFNHFLNDGKAAIDLEVGPRFGEDAGVVRVHVGEVGELSGRESLVGVADFLNQSFEGHDPI